MDRNFALRLLLAAWAAAGLIGNGSAAAQPLSPEHFLGHPIAADYTLDRWERIHAYFRHVDEESPRVAIRTLGQTTEGRPMIIAVISAAETIRDLQRHRDAQRKIADPRLIHSSDEEHRLVHGSKPVVLISCNLHSSEIASSQMVVELLYELASGESAKVREILNSTILVLVPSANPDGLDRVIDWYEPTRGKPWEGIGMPWLYQKYAGHDNNRDWFMLALKETRMVTEVLYKEWFPTIVYDIHQMGNSNARFFLPPFHDPKNANVHPLIDQSLMIIGGHMATELAQHDKKGVVTGAMFDNWWAGGFRTTPYRHNMIGILTEAASPLVATPIFQRKSDLRGGGRGMPEYAMTTNFPDPWPGGWWRIRDVADYEKIACYSLLTLAGRYHDMFQGNYVRLGREALARGKGEPPYAWLVHAEQRDPGRTAKMLEILQATGIEIHRAESAFEADGARYPAGSYILYCEQPYRAHLMDMFELQTYPDRSRTPGGPAEAPYDIAGWTLPLQMGVTYAMASRPFDAMVKPVERVVAPRSRFVGKADAAAYRVPRGTNSFYQLVNRLNRAGIGYALPAATTDGDAGLIIREGERFRARADELLEGLSLEVTGIDASEVPAGAEKSRPVRLGLYQPWVASMDEGWTRLVLDNHEFAYETIHNEGIKAGKLRERLDCLVLPAVTTRSILEGHAVDATAPEYVGGIGLVGLTALQDFVREGGTLVCIDDSCNLPIDRFGIPVKNLVRGKSSTEFYCPGSVLRVALDTKHPLAAGLPGQLSGYFVGSQAFEVEAAGSGARSAGRRFPATVVARYGDTVVLESGWIRGEKLIADQPAVVEVQYGEGRIVLLGFRVQHRAQPHGTFPLLFNAILRGAAQ